MSSPVLAGAGAKTGGATPVSRAAVRAGPAKTNAARLLSPHHPSKVAGLQIVGIGPTFRGSLELNCSLEREMSTFRDRITIDPAICHGKPTVRGLRYPVEMILDLLSSGMSHDEILSDYPDLEREDILAVLEYAARLSRVKTMEPLTA
jgi:uncharacterized protein (DUF433 family)